MALAHGAEDLALVRSTVTGFLVKGHIMTSIAESLESPTHLPKPMAKGFSESPGFRHFRVFTISILLALVAAAPSSAQSGQILGLANNCLDVLQSNTDDGTPVVMWQCTGNPNQDWRFVEMTDGQVEIRGLADKCLIVGDVGPSGHPEVEIGACADAASRWNVDGSLGNVFKLIDARTGRCLDVLGSETANRTTLITFDCQTQANQAWRLVAEHALPAYAVPFYEYDHYYYQLQKTTLVAVRNPAPHEVLARYQYFGEMGSPDSEPTYTEINGIPARGVRSMDVFNIPGFISKRGWIGITAVDGATGKPLAVQDLYGDFFRIQNTRDLATGDRILTTASSLCNTWHVRFLNGGGFDGGTTFQVFTPEFEGESWRATVRVFDELGQQQHSFALSSEMRSQQIRAESLFHGPSFGAVEWTFDDDVRGHLAVATKALNRFSVGFEAECRD